MPDYLAACENCELHRTVTNERMHRELQALLAFDRRKSQTSSKGLALTADYPPLLLLKGDRLEPCADLPDVVAFDSLVAFPRRSSSGAVLKRA
eukprot:11225548-Lingulodinium_polyedra.AAC.1